MRVINKRNLYPIFFLSGILILVLFFSGFSFLESGVEGLTTATPTTATPTATTPIVNAATPPVPTTDTTTVPINVSPATAAIVSGALDSIVQMGFAAVKTTNAVVKQMDAAVKDVEANVAADSITPSSTTSSAGNWVPINSTSTSTSASS